MTEKTSDSFTRHKYNLRSARKFDRKI